MKKRGLSVVLALVMSATICTIPSYAENGIYKEILRLHKLQSYLFAVFIGGQQLGISNSCPG